MSTSQCSVPPRYVYDVRRRRYRTGESDRQILGHSRGWVAAAAWLAMLAVSTMQYGYGVLMPSLEAATGDVLVPIWALALWVVCHSLVVVPLSVRRRSLRMLPRAATALGGLCVAVGLVSVAHADNAALLLLGYGVVGGVGSGLVYGSAVGAVSAWYPERSSSVSFISGAFCYGAIPFLFVAGIAGSVTVPLDALAVTVVVIVGGCALVLRVPPADWWPWHVDPRAWALDRELNPQLRGNRPAVRMYSTGEVLRCRVTWWMYLVVVCAAAMALFDIAYLGTFARANGWDGLLGAGVLAVLAATCGLVRGPLAHLGDRYGRPRLVAWALCVGCVAQLLLLWAGVSGHPILLVVAAGPAGAAAGTCYALLPALVATYWGERPGLPNFAVLYSAKAVGGCVGVGLTVLTVAHTGAAVGFGLAALLAALGAITTRMLRTPGLPALTLPGERIPVPRGRGSRDHAGVRR